MNAHRLPDRPTPNRLPVAVAVGATVLALGLGLWRLGRRSFWYDEAFTVGIVDRPFGDVLWRITHWEVNQSPYYLLFTGWFRLGDSDAFLRFLSVLFAVAAVPAIFLLGRRIADARVGAVAAVLLALHPLAVQWGQQLRAYSMVLFGVIVATILLLRAVERPEDPRRAILYAVVAAVTIYTQFFALLVVLAHLGWVALLRPVPRRVVAASVAAIGVLILPLGWYLATYSGDPLAWVADATDNLGAVARGLTGGHLDNVAVYGAAVAVGGSMLWWHLRDGEDDPRTLPHWKGVLPVLWLTVPVVVTLVVSFTVKPLLETRFLIVVVPALVLVAAYGLCRVPWRSVAVALGLALVVGSVHGLHTWYTAPSLEDWRAAVPVALTETGDDGELVLEPRLSLFAVRHYRPDGAEMRLFDPEVADQDPPPRLVELIRDAQRPRELDPLYELWRGTHYDLVDTRHFEGLTMRIFQARAASPDRAVTGSHGSPGPGS